VTSPETPPDLVFEPALTERLLEHARTGAPYEVCGVLGGVDDQVTRAEPVSNIASTPRRRYELDPTETVEAIDRVEQAGEHLGFYHSHPQGPPHPSATDEAEATWPGFVYCIVSSPDSAIRAWRWTGERFEELAVETR
jgi:proteasome lid subunit RPN8/RPN11